MFEGVFVSVAGGLIVAAILGGGGWWLRRRRRDRPDGRSPESSPSEPPRIRLKRYESEILREIAQRENQNERVDFENLMDELDLERLDTERALHRLEEAGYSEWLEGGEIRLTKKGVDYAYRHDLYR